MRKPLSSKSPVLIAATAMLVAITVNGARAAKKMATGVKESKFFKVDLDARKVLAGRDAVPAALAVDLTSVTTDQPQYWPNEKVFLKVLMLGQPKAKIKAHLQKRDAQGREIEMQLDEQGLAVVEIMNGEKKRLELGEYSVEATTADGRHKGNTTFAIVEGTLGGLSFAHEWKKVTSPEGLEREKGAWFLGNAAGAGKRWGNGLNFKNELRLNNKPYNGVIDIHSRCMLPGCDGTWAGRSIEKYHVENGLIAGTLDVGGHSGPFQIEITAPQGNLRYQFEGSSHVERDMSPVSGGVSWNYTAGLAPYEKTEQVPGRQIFVTKDKGGADAFVVNNLIASKGRITVETSRKLKHVVLAVYRPGPHGGFEKANLQPKGDLASGTRFEVEIAMPFSFVTLGGFADNEFVEGWVIAFPPAELKVDIDAPERSSPKSTVQVKLRASDGSGHSAQLSGILEAYDNRVVSKSALQPIGSAIGDGMRNASNAVSTWQDDTGIEEISRRAYDMEEQAERPPYPMAAPGMAPPSAPPAPMPMAASKIMAPPMGSAGPAAAVQGESRPPLCDAEAPAEAIREGEKKVVFCGRVVTDAQGNASADVVLPPQMGRVVFRFVAVRGVDFASAERSLDSTRAAATDVRVPRVVVPGAQLKLAVDITNATTGKIEVSASGAGIATATKASFAPGNHTLPLDFVAGPPGKLVITTSAENHKVLDRLELPIASIAEQPVTYSRLEMLGSGAVNLAADETVVVYRGSGELLHGVVMNMFTTMESWFGHAEALSAKVAAQAVIVAAISRHLLDDDGMKANLIGGLDKATRDLEEAFFDRASGLLRPYPGLAPDPLWSGWASKNLHAAKRALAAAQSSDVRIANSIAACARLCEAIDKALAAKGLKTDEQFGFDRSGNDVVPVEIDGKVVYRVVTDDSVTRWAARKLLAKLPQDERGGELAFAKALDTFRFLRAFERVGGLQYLTEIAMGLFAKGDMASFVPLYRTITRGMILAQEPGMLQGPALLGGVYSTPMAMVRFLELELQMAAKPAAGQAKLSGKPLAYGKVSKGPGAVAGPPGAIARIDRKGTVRFDMSSGAKESYATVKYSATEVKRGGELHMRVELDSTRNPLEYYALIAVPSTTSVKQTVDILSDYRGQLIYGQQGMGSQQIQMLAVPFRGSRNLDLLLEGAYEGSSPGMVIVRHIENSRLVSTVPTPSVRVR